MRVFLSWSGDMSRAVAEALRDWLPSVIQAIEPWMSSEDIDKGSRWNAEVVSRLSDTTAGIVCLTADNVKAPWIHFEAGAVSKTIERTLLCPYLFGLKPTDVYGPLLQFQAAESNKQDTSRLLRALNRALGSQALSERQLERTYERWWPDLEARLNAIAKPPTLRVPMRSDRDLIEEILTLVRALAAPSLAHFVTPSPAPPPSGGPTGTQIEEMFVKNVRDWTQQPQAERLQVLERMKKQFPEVDLEAEFRALGLLAPPRSSGIRPFRK